jgi:hypothetical protein
VRRHLGGPEVTQARAPAGDRDRDEAPARVGVRDQRAVAEPIDQLFGCRDRARARSPAPARVMGPAPDRGLELPLPVQQRRRVSPVEHRRADLAGEPPQLGQLGRQAAVERRPRWSHLPGARARALRRGQHRPGAPRLDGQAQADRRQRGGVHGRLRAQLGGPQRGAVGLDHAQAGRHRRAGAGRVAARGPQHRLGVPRRHPQPDGAAAPRGAGAAELVGRDAVLPDLERREAGDDPGVERFVGPAAGGEVVGRAPRRAQQRRRAVAARPGGAQRRGARQRRPRVAALAGERTVGEPRLLARGAGIAVEQRGMRQGQARLGKVGVQVGALELGDRLLGGLAALGHEVDRQQDLTAVVQQHAAV